MPSRRRLWTPTATSGRATPTASAPPWRAARALGTRTLRLERASDQVVTVSRPVSGVLSQRLGAAGGHPSERPTRGSSLAGRVGTRAPCSTLLRVGVAEPPGSPRTLVRSYRTLSPLPVAGMPAHRRSALCCPIRQVTPSWLSPAPCPVEPRLSSTRSGRAAATRPTHRRRPFCQRRLSGATSTAAAGTRTSSGRAGSTTPRCWRSPPRPT